MERNQKIPSYQCPFGTNRCSASCKNEGASLLEVFNFSRKKSSNMEMSSLAKWPIIYVEPCQPKNTDLMLQILGQPSGGWPLILQCFC